MSSGNVMHMSSSEEADASDPCPHPGEDGCSPPTPASWLKSAGLGLTAGSLAVSTGRLAGSQGSLDVSLCGVLRGRMGNPKQEDLLGSLEEPQGWLAEPLIPLPDPGSREGLQGLVS